MKTSSSIALAALVSLISLTAEAGSSAAWTAAKANLPKETAMVVGLDLAQVQKSSLWSLGFSLLMSQQPDAKDALETIKSACKLDPLAVVQSMVVASDENQVHGAIYFEVKALDQPKLVACMEAVVAANVKGKDAKVAVKSEGKIMEVDIAGKLVYLSWVAPNVLVVPLDFKSKADLQAWTGAKGVAKSKVARGIGKVNTGGAVWAVSGMPKDLDDNTKMKMGYGAVTLAGGTLGADLHVQLASPKAAKDASTKAQGQLTQIGGAPDVDATVKKVVSSIKVEAAGDEMSIKGSMAESDVLGLVMALKN